MLEKEPPLVYRIASQVLRSVKIGVETAGYILINDNEVLTECDLYLSTRLFRWKQAKK